MKYVLNLILFFATIGVVTWAVGDPKSLPPTQLAPRQVADIARWKESLAQVHPQIVLLGNSMLGHGINIIHFQMETGIPAVKLWDGGVASAWRYLMLKNLIVPSPDKPEMVIIFFKDHYLTEPTFRVTGEYKLRLDALRHPQEPLLDHLAFGQELLDPLSYLISDHWSLDRQREFVKPTVEKWVKQQVGQGLHIGGTSEVDDAIGRVFADSNLNKALFTQAQLAAMDTKTDDSQDFNTLLENSFLPAEIEIARKAGVKLVYVRIKRVQDALYQEKGRGVSYDNPYMTQYMKDLRAYLTSNDIPLLDFTQDTRLKTRHYADGDHLNDEGRYIFTAMLTEALRGKLPTPRVSEPPFAELTQFTEPVPLDKPFKARPPYGWIADKPEWLDYANEPGDTYRSVCQLLEDGVPIGERTIQIADIASKGEGRFNHWLKSIYFSASDNTDPNTNGRTYSVRFILPQ